MHEQSIAVDSGGRAEQASLAGLEALFVHNWAALAGAFGMDPILGRVHAVSYLACEAVTASQIAQRLGIDHGAAEDHLRELASLGVGREVAGAGFVADADPWSWFLGTLKERGRREFAPLLSTIRETNRSAQALRRGARGDATAARRIERIGRFTQFVDQIASLLETFATLGAGPMVTAMRMVAKVRGPRLL